MMQDGLYFGTVTHRRLRPFHHAFHYPVFYLWADLDRLPRLGLRTLSHNRSNLFSFHDRDHGPRDGQPLRPWIEDALQQGGIDDVGGPIRVLCLPRVLGYVFNPLTIFFCYATSGRLLAVLYEVKNTFGGQHSYLLRVPEDRAPGAPIVQSCDKCFYVSPFIDMQAHYRFRVREPDDRLSVLIRETLPEGEVLVAALTGRRRPLTDRLLLWTLLRYPFLTLKVMFAIHWQALRLWLKGARFHHDPGLPKHQISA